jgi:hypothetical protein
MSFTKYGKSVNELETPRGPFGQETSALTSSCDYFSVSDH